MDKVAVAIGRKLNLGCRDRAIPGFEGMDCEPHPGVRHIGDVFNLTRFNDGEIAEIYASHILEHAPHTKTIAILKEWARVLCQGGILYVAVPDFRRVVDLYVLAGLNRWTVEYLWGGQEYDTAFHYTGFDAVRLKDLLLESGFCEASQVDEFPVGHSKDCSRTKSTLDGKCVSLNILAVK